METLLKILKEWENEGETYAVGDYIKIDADEAKSLIESGTAREATEDETRQVEPVEEKKAEPEPEENSDENGKENEAKSLTDRLDLLEKQNSNLQGQLTAYSQVQKNRRPMAIRVGRELLVDDPKGGFKSFGTFALDVKNARTGHIIPEPLSKWNNAVKAAGDGMAITAGFDGGYLIPSEFSTSVQERALEASVVRPRATVIPMATLRTSFPVVDDTSHASTVFGGIASYFKSEEAALTASKPQFSEAELQLHKHTTLAYVSGEMLDWSPISIDSWLPMRLAMAMAWKEDDKFISGVGGAGEPIGLLFSACKESITAETGQTAETIVFENITKMDAQLWAPSGKRNCIWIANQSCKPQLAQLHMKIGTGGIPVLLPGNYNGAESAALETLYGLPIVFTEKAQVLGTEGDLMLCNLDEYIIGDAAGKNRSDRNIGLKFDYDQTAFRVITYVGGMCTWRSSFTPKDGGNALSPIITVATRS